ncbi:MAG: DUF3617 family protein [Comamonadaceae bacterium]|nr:MAG: DUF3617 family protein [Comamonadaceae bacterium]
MYKTMRVTLSWWSIVSGVIAAFAGPALAQPPLPERRAGLWEVTVRNKVDAVTREQKVLQCTSKDTEGTMLLAVVPGQEHCHDIKVKRTGAGHELRTVCYVHDNRVDATVQLSGNLQTSYRGAFEVKYSLPVRFNPGRTEFEGRWLGSCKPGQRAGDMELPNGATVNVVADRKRAESSGHEGHHHGSGHKH